MEFNGINFEQGELDAFCKRHRIARLSLFGSVLRNDFAPSSDVDILVEFERGARVSLFDLGGMALDLKQMIGREVDLRTPMDLSERFRDEVVCSAMPLYAA